MYRTQRRIILAGLLACFAATLSAQTQPPGTPIEVLTFGRVIAGELPGGVQASTQLLLTNRDPQQSACDAIIFFNTGSTASSTPVLFNGQETPSNAFDVSIPQGGASKITLTVPGGFVEGAVLVAALTPCNQTSINGTARFTLDNGGQLSELYTIAPNTPDKWLKDGRCVAISTCLRRQASSLGFGNNLGIATTGVFPGQTMPTGSTIQGWVVDSDGNELSTSTTFPASSQHQAFFPLDGFSDLPDTTVTLILCFFTPDPNFALDLTTIQVGTDVQGGIQFDAPIFADGFESGDTSAWSSVVNQ